LAVRGFILAKTGWKLEYINKLPEDHLLFVYHYLRKNETEQWEHLGAHLGTIWDRNELLKLQQSGAKPENSRIFVPLSLVMNPDLPDALLGKRRNQSAAPQSSEDVLPSGDGLNTGMSLPTDTEIVNMAELSKDEFLSVIGKSGLRVRK